MGTIRGGMIAVGAGVALMVSSGMAAAQERVRITPYAGVGVGVTSLEQEVEVGPVDLALDTTARGFKAYVGARAGLFGLEAGYYDLGRFEDEFLGVDVETRLTGINLSALGNLPLGPVNLFARLGLLRWDAEVQLDNQVVADESGTDVNYGVGVAVAMSSNFSVRAEFERFDIDDIEIDFISIGLEARF